MLTVVVALLLATGTPSGSLQIDAPPGHALADPGGQAQSAPIEQRQPLVRSVAQDEWRIWSSPFRRASYSTSAVKKYMIPFAIIAAGLIASDAKTGEFLPNTSNQKIWSGRVSQLGAGYTLAAVSGMTWVLGRATDDPHAAETGWLALQALAHSEVIVFAMKQVTNRERPINSAGGTGFWGGGASFPSGHAAGSFAVASVFAREYADHPAAPVAAYSLAGLVALSRVGAQRHWLSDVFVGSATGFLIGRFVYWRHHDPSLPGARRKHGLANRVTPALALAPRGATLTWTF